MMCINTGVQVMRTNIVIDEKLTNEAFALTGLKTKRELVEFALQELVRLKKKANQQGLCDVFEALHKLELSDDPFPRVERQNRSNPFADEL
jgi:hypothetical protein